MFVQDRLKNARSEKGYSLSDLSKLTGIAKSTLQRYETGTTKKIPLDAIDSIERALMLPTGYIMGWEKPDIPQYKQTPPAVTSDYTTFPVIGEIAAGYDKIAVENWEGDTVDIPNSFLCGRSSDDFFVLRVKGDSMFPAYEDGDKVLILKQTTLNYSGQVGAVLYDDNIATLKKVEFKQGEDWFRMVPINPTFPPIMIENEDLEHCRILGIPKYLIREIRH